MHTNLSISFCKTYAKTSDNLKGLKYVQTHIYDIKEQSLDHDEPSIQSVDCPPIIAHVTILECVRESDKEVVFLPHITAADTNSQTQIHYGICPAKRSSGQNKNKDLIPQPDFWSAKGSREIPPQNIQIKIREMYQQITRENPYVFVW